MSVQKLARPNAKPEEDMKLIKVAIADANIFLREGLQRTLSGQSDLRVVGEAGDHVEVTDLVERTKPDVLLLDFDLPKHKTVPILLELKRKNVPTKVLIFASFPDPESILDTAKAGARGYVVLSGILPSMLIHAIRRIHRGEIWADRQLKSAETFAEFARQKSGYDIEELEGNITGVLSKRELEIIGLVAQGLTNEDIGKRLFVAQQTVKAHLNHIFHKLAVKNRTQAALLLVQHQTRVASGENIRRALEMPKTLAHKAMN